MRLYFVRHGETDWNQSERFQGHSDIPLNENGRVEISRLKPLLSTIEFDGVYASDLLRCQESAAIAGYEEPVLSVNLREMNFGIAEGLTYNEICKKHPELSEGWETNWDTFDVPNGESYIAFERRVVDEVSRIISQGGKRYLFFVHGGVIRAFLAYHLSNRPGAFWQYKVKNGTVCEVIIRHDGICYLDSFNRIS